MHDHWGDIWRESSSRGGGPEGRSARGALGAGLTTSASWTSCSGAAGGPFDLSSSPSGPFIEAVHPVPQRLAVHAPIRVGPAHPIQHRRKRQQTPTLVGLLVPRQAASSRFQRVQ